MSNQQLKKGEDYIGNCVVFFCHDGNGKFLMSKRSVNCRDEHGTWDPGGGGIEYGQTVEDAIFNEIKEEYCTDVISIEFLGYRDVHRQHQGINTHWIALDFKVLIDPTKVKNGEPHKLEEIAWFTLDALPESLHSQFPLFLEKYMDKLKF